MSIFSLLYFYGIAHVFSSFFLRIKVLVAVDGINGFWREARIRVAGKKEVSSMIV